MATTIFLKEKFSCEIKVYSARELSYSKKTMHIGLNRQFRTLHLREGELYGLILHGKASKLISLQIIAFSSPKSLQTTIHTTLSCGH